MRVALLVLAVLAACSSAPARSVETTVASPRSVPTPVTSEPEVTSTDATVPTTIPPPSTDPATTTTTPDDAIRQAVLDYWTAYWHCGQSPSTCDPGTFTAGQGRSRATLTEFIAAMVAQQFSFSPDLRGSYVRIESVTSDGSTATVGTCIFDAGSVVGPLGPDGRPTPVADGMESVRMENTLFNEGGVWLVGEESRVETLGEGDLCPVV